MLTIAFPLICGKYATVLVSVLSHWIPVDSESSKLYLVGAAEPLEVRLTPAGIDKLIRDAFIAMSRNAQQSPIYLAQPGRLAN